MNPNVDFFFNKPSRWQSEYQLLRSIALSTGLREELKWGCPCYTDGGNNIVLIHGFKEYCALLFFKGALLSDPEQVLITQTENTQSTRQIRFVRPEQVDVLEPIIRAYILEAIEAEKSGLKIVYKKTSEFFICDEFQEVLNGFPDIKQSFYALTPGRQRAYLLYFSSAKQSKTRAARVEKHMPRILQGKGLDD